MFTYNHDKEDKRPLLYVHGSPGLGKTYLLRELLTKKESDFPPGCAKWVKATNPFLQKRCMS